MYSLNITSGAGCYCGYLDLGPHRSSGAGLPTLEYHWTVADHVQAAINGCRIIEVVEYGENVEDEPWLEKMPAHLLIIGRKEGSAWCSRASSKMNYA